MTADPVPQHRRRRGLVLRGQLPVGAPIDAQAGCAGPMRAFISPTRRMVRAEL